MAHARVVKTEFLADERLIGLSPEAIIFLIGAASLADPNGVLENRPLRIKVAAMPHATVNPEQTIGSLVQSGVMGVSSCGKFLRIFPFCDWFNSYPNEKFFVVSLDDFRGTIVEHSQAYPMHTASIQDASNKTKDRTETKTKEESIATVELHDQVTDMCHAWPKVNSKGEAMPRPSISQTKTAMGELIRKGKTLDGLCQSAALYLRDFRENNRNVLKAPQFFFGLKGYWEDHYHE